MELRTKIKQNETRAVLGEWVRNIIRNPLSVTLTAHQCDPNFRLDEIYLSRDITFFLHRLNYKIFRKKYSRFGKKLGCFPVIEGNDQTNLHVHLTLERPDKIHRLWMEKAIRECWEKTRFGRSHDQFAVRVNTINDEGWTKYQLKARTKRDGIISSIDWINFSKSEME